MYISKKKLAKLFYYNEIARLKIRENIVDEINNLYGFDGVKRGVCIDFNSRDFLAFGVFGRGSNGGNGYKKLKEALEQAKLKFEEHPLNLQSKAKAFDYWLKL